MTMGGPGSPSKKSRTKSKTTTKTAAGGIKQPAPLTRSSLEVVREKIKRFVMSMPHEKKIEHKYVMKVKGKCLNHFLGIIKTDLPRLAVEGFP